MKMQANPGWSALCSLPDGNDVDAVSLADANVHDNTISDANVHDVDGGNIKSML